MASEKMSGKITQIAAFKGFAFVIGDDGISRFLHAKDVKPRLDFDRLYIGQGIKFISVDLNVEGRIDVKGNGLRAIEVEVIK